MESFCNLELAPDTAATASHSHCPGSCDAFNLLKHPWETSSAVALSSFAVSTSAASKACATPRSCDNTLALATPSSALLSLSSSFLPAPPSPIAALASSSILPPPPPPRAVPSQSLLDTARRLPNDAAAYRVGTDSWCRICAPHLILLLFFLCFRCCGYLLFMPLKFKAMSAKMISVLTCER